MKKLNINIKESSIEIKENGETYTVEIMREKDGTIWGVYPNKPNSSDIIFQDGMRNLAILFQKGILKLDDFRRQKKSVLEGERKCED